MAIELYRPGVRSLAVRKTNPKARRRYRFSAYRKRLRDPDTRMYESMLVFAKAIGQFAGTQTPPDRVLRSGVNAIFHWWCDDGPRGNGSDKRADAVLAAADAAEHFGFDPELTDSVLLDMESQWDKQRCRNGRLKMRARRPFNPQTDRVLQHQALDVPKYRFGGG